MRTRGGGYIESPGPVDSKGPQREESATFMGRIVGLLVLGLALAMFGFNNSALSWLGIVGLMVLVATSFVGAINTPCIRLSNRLAMASCPRTRRESDLVDVGRCECPDQSHAVQGSVAAEETPRVEFAQ